MTNQRMEMTGWIVTRKDGDLLLMSTLDRGVTTTARAAWAKVTGGDSSRIPTMKQRGFKAVRMKLTAEIPQ